MSRLLDSGLESIDIARSAGVLTGHGTDLHHSVQHRQPEELLLRRPVMNNLEIIQAATLGNATIMGIADKVGKITEGSLADLIVLNGNPLANIEVLCTPTRNLACVIRGGVLCIDRIRHPNTN
jgi:imidazolonepropionase-like amidohydrolase